MAAIVQTGMRPIAEMGTRVKVMVMAGTLLGLFTAAMDQTVVGTSMPRVIADLGGFGLYPWVGTGFMLASTTTVPIVGKLTDIYGRKPFYMAGIFVLLLGSALSGMSQNIEQLIAFRVVQGLGAGMIMGIAFAIVGDVFTPAERGRWAGLMSGVFASASVLGPLIGGSLTDHVGWRWVFYVNLPLGALALAVLFFGMPHVRPLSRPKLDYRGIFLLVATVVPMLLAFSWAGSRYDWVSPQIIGFLGWSAAGLAIFTYAELRTEEPLLPMSLFRDRVFTVSALVTLITGFAMFGSLFYIPLFVQGVTGSSATNSGLVTMPMMIAMAIASATAGQIMSRVGRYRLLGLTGMLAMVAGMYLLSTMDVASTRGDATRYMIVLGAGLGMSMPLFMLAVQNAVPYRLMGISTSTMQFLRSVGGTMGVAIMFSLIHSHYNAGLRQNIPAGVQDPGLVGALKDPQFLLNEPAFQRIQQSFLALGDQGQTLFDQTMFAVRQSLASAIADAFFVAIFVLGAACVVGLFMKDVPLRRAHYLAEEGAAPAPAAGQGVAAAAADATSVAGLPAGKAGAAPALRPIVGGANGGGAAAHPLARAGPFALLAVALGLVALILLRAGRRS
ncbi:MAG: MDR family MFS transporter [Dehalococcoidia bacterium]|nr:MDR family MFS transporter [Dehalococcoidia bacterium]